MIVVLVCLASDGLSQHLPSYLAFSYFVCGVSLHGHSSKVHALLLTLGVGSLHSVAAPDLVCGVAPLDHAHAPLHIVQETLYNHDIVQETGSKTIPK